MRLLLDECVPRPLLRNLASHDAHHVVDMGWSSKRNGDLLKLMLADRFEVMLTVDQNLPFQQNLRASGIGVVMVAARTNRVKELRLLIPQILEALTAVKPGELITVGGYPIIGARGAKGPARRGSSRTSDMTSACQVRPDAGLRRFPISALSS